MTALEYLNEVVEFGGVRVRRIDVERSLDYIGVTGAARLRYGSLPEVEGEPEEYWDEHTHKWNRLGTQAVSD